MHDVYLVVGLGNPGTSYAGTRHNAGFLAVERLGERMACPFRTENRFDARCGKGGLGGAEVLLCQPLTFMNRSGRSVARVVSYYKIDLARVLVVTDDLDLELGTVRLRLRGSSGGHNGLRSVAQELGTEQFARLKIGIGRRGGGSVLGHVLGRFDSRERELLELVLERVSDQVAAAVNEGFELAMAQYNGRVATDNDEVGS